MPTTKPPNSVDVARIRSVRPERTSGISIKPEPLDLGLEMQRFLVEDFRTAIRDRAFGDQTDVYQGEMNLRGKHLIDAARTFANETDGGIGGFQATSMPQDVLDRINKSARGTHGRTPFTELFHGYFDGMQERLGVVVNRAQGEGTAYFMDRVYRVSDRFTADMESLLEHMIPAGDKDAPKVDRDQILTQLMKAVDEPGEVDRTIIAATGDLMRYVGQEGRRGMEIFGKDPETGRRHLHSYEGGPLHQLEASLQFLNSVVQDFEGVVAMNRDLLGRGMDDETYRAAMTTESGA